MSGGRARAAHRPRGVAALLACLGAFCGWSLADMPAARAATHGRDDNCSVWFLGSSSINRWSTLDADMRPWSVHNHGIDGATIPAVTDRLLRDPPETPPRAIVFYGGDNDIAYGETPAATLGAFRDFLAARDRRLGPVPVLILPIKPSPARWSSLSRQTAYNQAVRALAGTDPTLTYIEVERAMLRRGAPAPYYTADGLHMNPAGYRVWRKAVSLALRRALPRVVSHECTRRAAPAG